MRDKPTPVFGIDANIIAGMRAFGAPPEVIEQAEAKLQSAADDAEIFGVWEENLESFRLFTAGLGTQWCYAGMDAQRTGLNYAGVTAFLQLHFSRRRLKPLFADIQLMERAVLCADRELHDQKKA